MNFQLVKNVQILSALLWAVTIIVCSYFTKDEIVSTILITAAGFHVMLMSHFFQSSSTKKIDGYNFASKKK